MLLVLTSSPPGLNALFTLLRDPRHCVARTDGLVAVVHVLSAMAHSEASCRKLIAKGIATAIPTLLQVRERAPIRYLP